MHKLAKITLLSGLLVGVLSVSLAQENTPAPPPTSAPGNGEASPSSKGGEVQSGIKLSDKQAKQLKNIMKEYQPKIKALRKQILKSVKGVLKPHQIKQLEDAQKKLMKQKGLPMPKSPQMPGGLKAPKSPQMPGGLKAPKSPQMPGGLKAPKSPQMPGGLKAPKSPKMPDGFKMPNGSKKPGGFKMPGDSKKPDFLKKNGNEKSKPSDFFKQSKDGTQSGDSKGGWPSLNGKN